MRVGAVEARLTAVPLLEQEGPFTSNWYVPKHWWGSQGDACLSFRGWNISKHRCGTDVASALGDEIKPIEKLTLQQPFYINLRQLGQHNGDSRVHAEIQVLKLYGSK